MRHEFQFLPQSTIEVLVLVAAGSRAAPAERMLCAAPNHPITRNTGACRGGPGPALVNLLLSLPGLPPGMNFLRKLRRILHSNRVPAYIALSQEEFIRPVSCTDRRLL